MDKKTIGAFIAVLRKANGMTQKDFAEKLNVSDKAVSRWERDECAPDLSLLPVIAEIFGVTCDEILRGERRPAASLHEEDYVPDNRKTEKQVRQLYASSLQRYQSRLMTASGLTVASALVMLVCSYGFYQSVLGFGLAMALIASSLIWVVNSTSRALGAAGDEECGGEQSIKYRRTLIKYFIAAVCANITTALCLTPLVLLHSAGYAKRVLQFYSWLPTLPFCLLISAGVCLSVFLIVRRKTIRNPLYAYDEKDKRNFRLQTKTMARFSVVTAAFLAAFLAFMSIDPINYAAKTGFDSLAGLSSALGEEQGEPVMSREYCGLSGTRWYSFAVNADTNYWDNAKMRIYEKMNLEGREGSPVRIPGAAQVAAEGFYILPEGQTEKIAMKNFSFAVINIGNAGNGNINAYAITWDSLDRAVTFSLAVSIALLCLCAAVPVLGVAAYFNKRER